MVYCVLASGHCKYRGTDTMPCLQEVYGIVVGYRMIDRTGVMDRTGDDEQCRDDGQDRG